MYQPRKMLVASEFQVNMIDNLHHLTNVSGILRVKRPRVSFARSLGSKRVDHFIFDLPNNSISTFAVAYRRRTRCVP